MTSSTREASATASAVTGTRIGHAAEPRSDAVTAPDAVARTGTEPARAGAAPASPCASPSSGPSFGPERRRHRVYVTRNTEYHVRDGTCVAVRDRRTGGFLHGHLAIDRRVEGGFKFFRDGAIAPNAGEPRPGESIYFASEGRDLVTSPLEHVERPAKEVVLGYPVPPQVPGPAAGAGARRKR